MTGTDVDKGSGPSPGEPLVTVVMNCFNGEKYLREAIDSVYAQTYGHWEIVFWDNASTDGSAAIARSYDPKLRYFRAEETIPLGAARNRAVEQARGNYIALLDVDDIWFPKKLEKQVLALEGNDFALCYAGIVNIDSLGREIGACIPTYPSGHILDHLLRQFDINVPAALVRRSALEASKLNFDPKIVASEEYCLFMQLAADHPFCVLHEPVAKYRIHDAALTNRSISRWADEREYTLNRIRERHPGIENRYRGAFREAYARARYYRARWYVFQGEKAKAIGELRKTIFVHYRYFALFLILFMPTSVWNRVHRARTQRSLCS